MPVATMTALAVTWWPSARCTTRFPSRHSRPAACWENTMCAPNIQACSQDRRVSSYPLTPCGKPG